MHHLTISDEQGNELRQRARAGEGRVSERMHFVLLSGQGHSPPAIGQLLGYDVATVRTWLAAYEAQGIAGLQDGERRGRPPQEKNRFCQILCVNEKDKSDEKAFLRAANATDVAGECVSFRRRGWG